jgi:hypothetical protein
MDSFWCPEHGEEMIWSMFGFFWHHHVAPGHDCICTHNPLVVTGI